ncbi:2-dehydro-3-deoxy-6-phosphogalactonate aldolase [Altererythrobacter salegens]|uniref:2-dehydro-3-deoxy-6-phosphogalactonate aldolase n=1 Tax=Croceibacterium salegens TaxID=1737568 RepID=A0A6I4SXU5_9SPHN|nr:2-dehydro-3-deoxy-6-phosphogalactonate aldolase [Croceibacterium salegens]MXO60835.1 2-dehydro-3-deoxy-6-phosphogalactonate aldolase [Croceibacterium salegens]
MTIDQLLAGGAPPVVAILRGVRPGEVTAIGAALIAAGIRMIEVPLNSPEPFASIAALQDAFGDRALTGAGTVLDVPSVDRLADTGAGLLVAPNTDPQVIARGAQRGLDLMPGFMTPSEAFAAIAAGARRLKLFPAFTLGPAYVGAIRDVLPPEVGVWAVGGVDAGNIREWPAAGAEGVALGSSLYRPGHSAAEVRERAEQIVAALAG